MPTSDISWSSQNILDALIPLPCLMLLSKFLLNTFHPRSTSMEILVKRISTLGCEPRQRQALKERGAERFLQWL